MRVLIAKDESTYREKVAQLFLESSHKAVQERSQFSVALSGGSTPKKVLPLLSESYYRQRVPWANIHFFWGDERCVPPDHEDSNYGMVRGALLSKVPVSTQNIYRMAGEIDPPRDAAKAYENSLRTFFKNPSAPPQFDLIYLGLGEDGHTASLFPGTEALNENHHWVVANYVEKFSAYRLTLTYPVLNNARQIIFLSAGASKADIVKEIFRSDLGVRYPSQRINPEQGELIWLLDTPAASKLPHAVLETAVRF